MTTPQPDEDMTLVLGQGRYDAVTGWRRFFTWSYWRCRWWLWRMGKPNAEIVSVGTLHLPDPDGKLVGLEQPKWATGNSGGTANDTESAITLSSDPPTKS